MYTLRIAETLYNNTMVVDFRATIKWMRLFIYLFIFTSLTVDLKLLIYTKKALCSLYGNNIATSTLSLSRKCNLSRKNFSDQCEKTDRHRHICSHIDQINIQTNAFIPVQWVFCCSLYKSYMLQIYFAEPTRTLQRHSFLNFSFKNT